MTKAVLALRMAWAAVGGAAALVSANGVHGEGRGDIRVVKTVVNGGGFVDRTGTF